MVEEREGQADQDQPPQGRGQEVHVGRVGVGPGAEGQGPSGDEDGPRIERQSGRPVENRSQHGQVPAPHLKVGR